MAAFNIPIANFFIFLLIFLRVGAILFTAPLFDARSIPTTFKIGLAISISILLYPVINISSPPINLSLVAFVIGVVAELAVGIIIGFSVKMLFTGIQLAGQVAGYQMGFAIANVVDPATSMQIPLLAQFNNIIAMLVFLAVDAHHIFFKALVHSFSIIPPFGQNFHKEIVEVIMHLAANMFVVAIELGAPIIAVMLFTSVALGLIARTVPQIHILIVAMPVKIFIGLVFMALILPFMVTYLKSAFFSMGETVFKILKILAV